MSTPSRSDNPFHGFSTRRARSPVNPLSSDQVPTLAPMPPLVPISEEPPTTSASTFPIFPIVTPIMNPFAVGHPTGLQTVTAHALPSSSSSQRSRRSHNLFNLPVGSTPAHESPIPTLNIITPIGFQRFLPPSPIPHHHAPLATPLAQTPTPLVAPPVTLQDTINMFSMAFTQSFTQVQNQLQPIVLPPAIQPPRPDPAKTKLRAPDPFDGTETSKLRSFLVQCQLNFADRPSTFATDRSKVNYTMSYLKGIELAWFELYYLETPTPGVRPPLFMTDYAVDMVISVNPQHSSGCNGVMHPGHMQQVVNPLVAGLGA